MYFIQRDYNRNEHDDFLLNVSSRLNYSMGAVEALDAESNIVGWILRPIYE